jgi:SnoaL-like domain
MATVAQLMQANLLEVFNERDDQRRRAAIERTYGDDVTFSDPDEVVTGHAALDAKAKRLLDASPTFVFSPAGAILVNHDLGYLAWNLGPDGQPPAVRGIDIALVENGRIAHLYTLLTDEPSS